MAVLAVAERVRAPQPLERGSRVLCGLAGIACAVLAAVEANGGHIGSAAIGVAGTVVFVAVAWIGPRTLERRRATAAAAATAAGRILAAGG